MSKNQKIHRYLEKHNLSNIILIAHSKGGLIGKNYMEDENTSDNRVVKLIALATPFSGSYLAEKFLVSQIKELSPSQEVISRLSQKQKTHSQIISIFPVWDNHVFHKNKSYLEGAKNIEVDIPGHHRFLFSKEILKLIEREL